MRRSLGVVAATVLVATLALPGATAASSRPIEYLALGDSLAFGWNPLLGPADPTKHEGYADFVATALRDELTNAACPGETSSHLLSPTGTDNGCGYFRTIAQLHTDYRGAETQIAFADAFLAAHSKTQLVTIDIGANDIKALQQTCVGDPTCIVTNLPNALGTISANLDTIYRHLRELDGYRHKLVALTIYSTDYTDPALTGIVVALNAVVAARTLAWGGIVADGFGAFYAASLPYDGDACAAGLLIPDSTKPSGCDDHASRAGHELLAQTIVQALRAE